MSLKISKYYGLIALGLFALPVLGIANAQIQDLSCPSCVTIPHDEIDLYKEGFSLIIWTDSTVYNHDSIITLNGHLNVDNSKHPVTIIVTNPIGNLVTIEQITPFTNGDFTMLLNPQSPLWKQNGDYIIKAQSGSESRSFKTSITLIDADVGEKSTCKSREIITVADNGGVYCISYIAAGEITGIDGFLNIESKTLILNVRGSDIGSMIISLPRYLLDATSDRGDESFVMLLNGQPYDYEELDTISETHRDIKIAYPPNWDGQIEIVGTSVVPEFSTIAVLVLAVSITVIVFVSRKNLVLPIKI